nr:MAG TPA: hypothetical protein [Caudoviricetes sp.]
MLLFCYFWQIYGTLTLVNPVIPTLYFSKLSMRSMNYRRFLASSKTVKTPISKGLQHF